MSKLDDLINKLCPDGVEFKKIENVCEISRGIVMSKDYIRDNAGEYPVFSSQTENNGCLGKINTYKYDGEYLTWTTDGANAGTVFYRKGKFSVTNVCGLLKIINEDLSTKFLYYALSIEAPNHVNRGMGNAKLMSNVMGSIKIPVPPIEIQNEIVQILDKFTSLEAELEAELEARRKQYEYYRDSLLKFGDDTEWKTLEELCSKVTDGSHFSPKAVDEGYPMPSVKDMTFNSFNLSDCKKISKKDYDDLVRAGCKPLIDDVLIAKDGSMLKYAFPVKQDMELVILSSIAILRPKTDIILPDYFAHYFRQESFREIVIRDYSSKGGVPRIVLKNFKKIKIPVPSLKRQEEIVSILDRFESLCNDITSVLPAEIEARHKQYEYYRDKLLTFKCKEA